MSSQIWFAGSLFVGSLATLLVMVQLAWGYLRGHRQINRAIRNRLMPATESAGLGGARVDLGPVERLLVQADIRWSMQRLVMMTTVLLLALVFVAMSRGMVALLVVVFFVAIAIGAWWRIRFQKQRQTIHEELPGVVDAVMRNIDAGRSLEHALISSFDESSPVFNPLVFRLRNAVEAGRDYTRLFEDFAQLYQVPAMVLVAIALRTTSRFGSSIRPVLEQVSASLRSQQAMRREFLAASAETRFTAVTFAVLPPALAAFMVMINDEYSDVLLNTPTGHSLLLTAGALQLIGMFVIWRMIQGVGRG
ncbi:type II secretion system F family protein [Marinobacter sp. TBZ242]|uniref:Type II secretion system F family protein n=1 Tax=Marinobacter azerbaijanicus TaxID=3050455 RepID=A0ABT7ICJ4_9GAMM|nr:type II secretion system F family protein [Marinobacter sp. TBZ242]MDL0431873.1 type II secretion system F family protein [Marinobacter sp. TBZ242]